MSSCVGRAFNGGFYTSCPLINDREKSRIRFFDVAALVENPMRFEEGYLPGRDEQGSRQVSGRIGLTPTCSFRQRDAKHIRQFVAYRPGASLERFAGSDRLHESFASSFEETDVRALFGDGPMSEQP